MFVVPLCDAEPSSHEEAHQHMYTKPFCRMMYAFGTLLLLTIWSRCTFVPTHDETEEQTSRLADEACSSYWFVDRSHWDTCIVLHCVYERALLFSTHALVSLAKHIYADAWGIAHRIRHATGHASGLLPHQSHGACNDHRNNYSYVACSINLFVPVPW